MRRFPPPWLQGSLGPGKRIGEARRLQSAKAHPAKARKRADWSRRLPRPLIIPTVMSLKTRADVRELMRHLPPEHRERPTWRHVAAELDQAAAGADTVDVAVALRLALMLENVECRPKQMSALRQLRS